MKIGFIGLGNMGLPMAENLQKEGHEVTGFDINKNINSNIRISNSIEEIVKSNKAIFTMLPSGKEVIAVYDEIIDKLESFIPQLVREIENNFNSIEGLNLNEILKE